MANGIIEFIQELKCYTDGGETIPRGMETRLVLKSLMHLLEASNSQEKRIKDLENHDIVGLSFKHPRLALSSVVIFIIVFTSPYLNALWLWLGFPAEMFPRK